MPQESEAAAPRPALPMRLTRLRVKNFRSIADIDIPLSPLTVLVGPNGSGKSNVVDALRFVRDVFARGLDQAVMDREGMGVIQRWGTKNTLQDGVSIALSFFSAGRYAQSCIIDGVSYPVAAGSAVTIDYSFSWLENRTEGILVESEELTIVSNDKEFPTLKIVKQLTPWASLKGQLGGEPWIHFATGKEWAKKEGRYLWLPERLFSKAKTLFTKDSELLFDEEGCLYEAKILVELNRIKELLDSTSFFNLSLTNFRRKKELFDELSLDEEGSNFLSVLKDIISSNGDAIRKMHFVMQEIVPEFDKIELTEENTCPSIEFVSYSEDYHQYGQLGQMRTSSPSQESDGTLHLLGLLATLVKEPLSQLLIIEVPEYKLHFKALSYLAAVLEERGLRGSVLITTQNPDLLNYLPIESLLVIDKIEDVTRAGVLNSRQAQKIRDRLTIQGELFRAEGLQMEWPDL